MPDCKSCFHPKWAHTNGKGCEAVKGYTDIKEKHFFKDGHEVFEWTGEPIGDCDCQEFTEKGKKRVPPLSSHAK